LYWDYKKRTDRGGPLTTPLFTIKNTILFKKINKTIKKYTLVNKIVFFIEKWRMEAS
jgi:hypothetical protein